MSRGNNAGYRPIRPRVQGDMTPLGRNFFVHLAGKMKDAHLAFIEKFKVVGQTEVTSPEDSDYIVVFCPIVSRVGTDISEALNHTPGGKPIILMVMHHTFDPDRVVGESRRQVDNPNVLLTVDCLFYERRLLDCSRNDIAWSEVQKLLGVAPSQVSCWQATRSYICKCWRTYWKLILVMSGLLMVGVIITLIMYLQEK